MQSKRKNVEKTALKMKVVIAIIKNGLKINNNGKNKRFMKLHQSFFIAFSLAQDDKIKLI